MADRSVFAAITPLLGRHFRLTGTQLGVLLGPAFAVTYGIAAIGFGLVIDRGHARLLVLGGLVVAILAIAVTAASMGFAGLLAGRIGLGLGQAATIPAAMFLIVQGSASTLRPKTLAMFTGASALGRSLGLIASGAMLAAATALALPLAAWRLATVMSMAPAVVVLAMSWLCLPTADPVPAAPSPVPGRLTRLPLTLLPYFAMAVAPIIVGQSVAAWGPSLLVHDGALGAAGAATAIGAILLVFAPAAQALGALAMTRGGPIARHPIVVSALCLVVAEAFLALAALSRTGLGIGVGLAGVTLIGGTAAFVILHAVQLRAPPAQRGAVTGAFLALVTFVGAGSGPLLTGIISDLRLAGDHSGGLGIALIVVGAGAAVLGIVIAAGVRIGSVFPRTAAHA